MMSTILIKDLAVVEEISDEEAASIHGGQIRRPDFRTFFQKEQDAFYDSSGIGGRKPQDLYPGLGKQADNETPLVQVLPL